VEFAKRKNMPSKKRPKRGPLIIPNMDRAACGGRDSQHVITVCYQQRARQ